MADFCEQCSKDMGFPHNDLDGLVSEDEWKKGIIARVICEGCGGTQVDHTGRCVSNCDKLHQMKFDVTQEAQTGKWFHRDETDNYDCGPFETMAEAEKALAWYVKEML